MAAYYELIELLGEGGMGRVYRGVHRPSGTPVAVKTLHSAARRDQLRRRLFLDEATAAAKLDDTHIVRLLDLGRERDGTPFLVLELARGPSLEDMIARWAGWPRIHAALLGTLQGLKAAHAAQIIHRDLKPANILVDPKSGEARVLDFGVAAFLDPLRGSEGRQIVGTPEFMPPEQLSADGPIGPWTDLYAFGVILAHAVRGRSPFGEFENLTALLLAKSTHQSVPGPGVREGLRIPPALQDLIDSLLRPRPRDRPRFAVDVAKQLVLLGAQVVDECPLDVPVELAVSTRMTTVDPEAEFAPLVAQLDSSAEVVLPARLPAPNDVPLGAALARLRELPLIGRAKECEELGALIDQVVRGGGPRLCAYIGEAGIGKSRLARWGLSEVERLGTMESAAGGYDPSGADIAGGLRHAIRRLTGMPRRAWQDAWSWLANEPGLDQERLAGFLRADEDQPTIAVDAVVSLVHAVLRAIARVRPIYLWLDDLVWARDGALGLVEALLDDDLPILVVATMRAGATQHAGVKERIERMLRHPRAMSRELAPLTQSHVEKLLAHIAPLAPGIGHMLAERIEGSPLLLVQLVHDWVARGMLEPSGSIYRPRGGVSVDELLVERPLTALLADRVEDFLSAFGQRAPIAESVLGRAALLGARFEHAALRAACARDRRFAGALDEVLDRALLVGLLRSEGRVYAFDHSLVREALIDRIEQGNDRIAALIDAANGLQKRYGKERADIAALVAGLLYRAGDHDRAWERQLSAIERAAWAADDAAALGHVAVARAWSANEPERKGRVEHAEARAHYFALRYDRALDCIERARELAFGAGDNVLAMVCDATEADVLFYQDRFGEAERLAQRCFGSGQSEDPEILEIQARATQRLAEVAVVRGDLEGALRWREATGACAEATGQLWRVRVANLNLAEVLAVLDRTDEARERCVAVLEEARSERDDDGVTAAREQMSRIDVLAGRAADAIPFLEARYAEVVAIGDRWRRTSLSAYRALCAVELADEATIEGRTRELIDDFRTVPHDEAFTMAALRKLASKLEERGQFELAREIDALIEARVERYRAGFERTTDPDPA